MHPRRLVLPLLSAIALALGAAAAGVVASAGAPGAGAVQSTTARPQAAGQAGQPREPFDAVRARSLGMTTYWDHCASCHGRWGHGDGPEAKGLTIRPPDLTHLAERNGGTFPLAAVAQVIAGTDRVHSPTAMPAWAAVFRGSPGAQDDDEVRRRIEALTLYLEFIQPRPRK